MRFTNTPTNVELKEVQQSYDRIYRAGPLQESDAHYRWVIDVLAVSGSRSILDVACGGGYLLGQAHRAGLRCFGIDLSHAALELASGLVPQADLVCGVGEALPFADGTFDLVCNLGSLEHFLDPGMGVMEMFRVLKPGGRAAVLVPNSYFLMTVWKVMKAGDTGRQTDQIIDRWATRKEWSELIGGAGFAIEKVHKYNFKSKKASLKYRLVRPFIPMNLSYCFLFICSKS